MKQTFRLFLSTILIANIAAANRTSAQEALPAYLDETQPIELRVEDALSRMTIEEKVDMCHAQSKFTSPGCPRLGLRELHFSDGPHGVRAEIEYHSWSYAKWNNDSCTAFPALTCLTATWDPQMAELYGKALAEEALYRDKHVILGPGVNIYRTPLNGRNFEYMGEDPYLAARMCVPYIRSMQEQGVAACVKHYLLNEQEGNRMTVNVNVSDRALREIYLPPFQAAAQEGGAWSFMGSYNRYKGQHGCHNETSINQILKGEWGFDGVVVSDWGGTHDAREAALYGLDIEFATQSDGLTKNGVLNYDEFYLGRPFREMLKKGEVPMSVLDDKCRRILRLMMRTNMNRHRAFGSLASPEHAEIARIIGRNGIVLLKNDATSGVTSRTPRDKGSYRPMQPAPTPLLPLQADRYERILVVGENATRTLVQAGGSSELKPKREVSPLEGLKEKYGDKISYAMGYKSGKSSYGRVNPIKEEVSQKLYSEAISKASEADLVIYIGGLNKNHKQDCEAGDRDGIELSFGQDSLISALAAIQPNIVVVLMSGNAVAMPWIDEVPAIVQGWYLGSESGHALVDVLCGDVSPSGKLPFSFPVKLSDCGAHSFGAEGFPGVDDEVYYKEDVLVGYRWHDTKRIAPLFPFGHGLSYTTFQYGKAQISSATFASPNDVLTITVPITNVGERTGAEVVQLYVGDNKAPVLRPTKELKAFQKVTLAPGETKEVRLEVKAADLTYYNDGLWHAEPGTFTFYVAASATDVKQKLTAKLTAKIAITK